MDLSTGIGRVDLSMAAVRVTEKTSLAASALIGRGDQRAADEAAFTAMHEALKALPIDGTVRVGEGWQEETSRLYVGEKIGSGSTPQFEVAVIPLEGSTAVARGNPNALSAIAFAEGGGFLNPATAYMDKLAIGVGLPDDLVDLDEEPGRNLRELAKAKGIAVDELVVCILDRPRHDELIAKTREAGARIKLIGDGDISGAFATTWPQAGVDIYMGIGGTPHGVLAAAALASVGGQMQGRLVCWNDDEKRLAKSRGVANLERKYTAVEMAAGDITFAATGTTSGTLLLGVRRSQDRSVTHSLMVRSHSRQVRYIETHHGLVAGARAGD